MAKIYREWSSNYALLVNNCESLSCQKIRSLASDFILSLDEDLRDELFDELKRGTAILETEPQMQMYIYAYSQMHIAKLNIAYKQLVTKRPRFFKQGEDFCIIDYGCGQGLATVALADFLRKNKIPIKIDQVILIDASKKALCRAALHITKALPNVEIKTVLKSFDDLEHDDLEYIEDHAGHKKLHILSNVLDMDEDDSQNLAELISSDDGYLRSIVCCSPFFGNYKDDYMEDFVKTICSDPFCKLLYDEQFEMGEFPNNDRWTANIKVINSGMYTVFDFEDNDWV